MVAFDDGLDVCRAFTQGSEAPEVRIDSDRLDASEGGHKRIQVCSDAELEHPVERGEVAGDPTGDLIGPEGAESDRSMGIGHGSSVVVMRVGPVDSPPEVP